MRKVIFQNMVTLDGYFEGPGRDITWHNVDDEFNDYAIHFLDTIDTLVFGRVTYQLMESYWPTQAALNDDPEVARRMNNLRKVVFSKTLRQVNWQNTSLANGDAAKELKKLKAPDGKNIAIFGSSNLSQTFLKDGLVDELRIIVNPVLIGSGSPLFQGIQDKHALKLTKTQAFKSGNVMLTYTPLNLSGA